jgi:hypothetical protein
MGRLEQYQAVRVSITRRLEQDLIQHAEYSGVGAYADRQSEK